jgi:hypothetical protein
MAGILSGVVVLLGVFLTHLLARRQETMISIERATMEIALELPIFANFLSRPESELFAPGSQSWLIQQEVKKDLATIDAKTRKRKGAFADVRKIADEMSARIGAAEIRRFRDGILLSSTEYISLCDSGLSRAVFGDRNVLDETISKYVQNGLPVE